MATLPKDLLRSLQNLTPKQRQQLIDLLTQPPSRLDNEFSHANRIVIAQHKDGKYFYQLEKTECGKKPCRCHDGVEYRHGPYWYAYWREGKRIRSVYIGKRLRQDLTPEEIYQLQQQRRRSRVSLAKRQIDETE